MSRISDKLTKAKRRGGGFIPFVTAGDPDFKTSLSIILKLAEMGSDVIELGVPFSDPMADGPTIQRSSERALANGATLKSVLSLAKAFRKQSDVPVVLFSYFNPILRFGVTQFAEAAADAGVDGVLLTDVIEGEAAVISAGFALKKIDLISLIAPTTSDDRLAAICSNARGFVYAVSRAGVTGARQDTSSTARELVERARQFTELPIAVGFGISTAEQIIDVCSYADAAVVGSALVAVIERAETPEQAVNGIGEFVARLLPQFAKRRTQN
ncbi:MAG: tryptophan synthase subunit alpha [Acidobacteriota bacterium]